jgi:hypothetical protein
MRSDVEGAARESLSVVLEAGPAPDDFDLDGELAGEYGLTSLNKVLYLTGLCQDLGIALSHLTEQDVAAMRTLRQVVDVLTPHLGKAA